MRRAVDLEPSVLEQVADILDMEQGLRATSIASSEIYETQVAILKAKAARYQPNFEEFFGYMTSLLWLSFVCLFFGFQVLADVTYAAVTQKYYNPWETKTIVDILIYFTFLVNVFVTLSRNWSGAIGEGP